MDYAGLPKAYTGRVEWDYNSDGVAHYGLLPDFLVHVGQQPEGSNVLSRIFGSAEAFARMWEETVSHADVWVDPGHEGVEAGTRSYPYKTLAAGLRNCVPGNAIRVKGSYSYSVTAELLRKSVRLRAHGGSVIINNHIRIEEGGFMALYSDGAVVIEVGM